MLIIITIIIINYYYMDGKRMVWPGAPCKIRDIFYVFMF